MTTKSSKSAGKRRKGAKTTRVPRGRRAGQTPLGVPTGDGITHVTQADGNIFEDLGFPPIEARNLLVRSDLMSILQGIIKGMTQADAARLVGVRQPRISDLKSDRIERFTIDALVNMLAHTGRDFRIVVTKSVA